MRVLAAQEGRMEHPRQVDIVHELRAPSQQAGVLVAAYRLSDEARHSQRPIASFTAATIPA